MICSMGKKIMHNVILRQECLSGKCSRTLLAILKFDKKNSILPLLLNTHRDFVDTIKSQDLTRHKLIDLILVVKTTV